MIRGIIFDMDGVLADSEHFYQQRRETFLNRMDYPYPAGLNFIGSNEQAIWKVLVPCDPLLREELMLGYRAYRKLHPENYSNLVDPAVVPLFDALRQRGILIGIASSSARSGILRMTEAAGITQKVDYIISGEDCTAHKPEPEIYLRALEALGLSAEQAIAVEDSPTGIASAKAAGLRVIALHPRHGEELDQSNSDYVIHQLHQILDYLD